MKFITFIYVEKARCYVTGVADCFCWRFFLQWER